MPDLLAAPPPSPAAPPGESLTPNSPLVRAWAERLGGIPVRRIVADPPPGTATEADWERVRRHGKRCELIDGTLVEKAVSYFSSSVGAEIIALLIPWLDAHKDSRGLRLGFVAGEQGFVRLRLPGVSGTRARGPDVSFVRRDRFPGGRIPLTGYPTIGPDFVVEVLSPGNTDREIAEKLRNFFAAGTVRAWVIDPLARTAQTYAAADDAVPVPADGALDAAPALPGFAVTLADLFADGVGGDGTDGEEE